MTPQEHLARALYNAALAAEYGRALPKYPDWEVVVRFYAALHFVQGYFMTKNERFEAKRHDQREQAIRSSPELTKNPKFHLAYRRLQHVSEQVRYDPGFVAQQQHVEQARTDLTIVESVVRTKLESRLDAT